VALAHRAEHHQVQQARRDEVFENYRLRVRRSGPRQALRIRPSPSTSSASTEKPRPDGAKAVALIGDEFAGEADLAAGGRPRLIEALDATRVPAAPLEFDVLQSILPGRPNRVPAACRGAVLPKAPGPGRSTGPAGWSPKRRRIRSPGPRLRHAPGGAEAPQ